VLGSLKTSEDPTGIKLSLNWSYPIPTSVMREPNRLVVDFQRNYSIANRTPLAQGVMMEQLWMGTDYGPLCANVIRADLNVPGVQLKPTLAREDRFALDTTSAIAKRNGAIAAINGTYFYHNGNPAGLILKDGKLICGPLWNRSVLGFRQDGLFIDNIPLASTLQLPDGQSSDFDGVNQVRNLNQLVLYDHFYGAKTGTKEGIEYTISKDGQILSISDGDSPIPQQGWVVSASGFQKDWLSPRLKIGDTLNIKNTLSEYGEGVQTAIGAGPTLLKDGQIKITASEERFKPDVAQGRAPRTAVGITPYGEILLVVVDGRQARYSVGMTLQELAKFMLEMGAKDAINLDGGGSSTVYAAGMVVNRCSDGKERRVSNALLLYGQPE
jgi:exopolysaccharide biosynthesis protein